ncbi:hypothetical protein [Trichlorobacter lovleyi]|uniref:hypothetical protein n=1 Tax=Trichlorobacter lovleyi TaxID=313985 RepID=UPI002FDD4C2B
MKKLILAVAAVIAMSTAATAADLSGLTLMGQTGFNPDHGGTSSAGAIVMFRGIGAGLYAGGDHSNNRGGGIGGDLRIDSSAFGLGFGNGKHLLTAYAEGGAAWQRGHTQSRFSIEHLFFSRVDESVNGTLLGVNSTQKTVDSKVSLAGGAGLTYNYAIDSKYNLTWSLGYHTAKGISTGLGVTFR